MVSVNDIRQMPTEEKLRLMDLIWTDLSSAGDQVPSPSWHAEALKETEDRVRRGEESAVDWEEAKRALRAERE